MCYYGGVLFIRHKKDRIGPDSYYEKVNRHPWAEHCSALYLFITLYLFKSVKYVFLTCSGDLDFISVNDCRLLIG